MDTITLNKRWRIDSDQRWALVDPDGRLVVSVVTKAELLHFISKLIPENTITAEGKAELDALPEFHSKSPQLGPAQGQVAERVWSDAKVQKERHMGIQDDITKKYGPLYSGPPQRSRFARTQEPPPAIDIVPGGNDRSLDQREARGKERARILVGDDPRSFGANIWRAAGICEETQRPSGALPHSKGTCNDDWDTSGRKPGPYSAERINKR